MSRNTVHQSVNLWYEYCFKMPLYIQYRSFITSLLHACTRKETRHGYTKSTQRVCVDHVSCSVYNTMEHAWHITSMAFHTRETWNHTRTCKMPRNMRGISRVRNSTQMGHGVIATCVI